MSGYEWQPESVIANGAGKHAATTIIIMTVTTINNNGGGPYASVQSLCVVEEEVVDEEEGAHSALRAFVPQSLIRAEDTPRMDSSGFRQGCVRHQRCSGNGG